MNIAEIQFIKKKKKEKKGTIKTLFFLVAPGIIKMMTQFKQNVSILKWSNDNQITEEKSEHGKNILKTIKSHNNLFTQILLG